MKKTFPLIAIFTLFTVASTHAGFQADIKIARWLASGDKKESMLMNGKVYAEPKSNLMRVDTTGPLQTATQKAETSQIVITDQAKRTHTVINPFQKTFLIVKMENEDRNFEMSQMKPNIEELKRQDYAVKKAGTERIDGHLCDIYDIDSKDKAAHLRTWVAADFDGMPLRSVVKTAQTINQIDFLNAKKTDLKPEVFAIPAGYGKLETPLAGQSDAARAEALKHMLEQAKNQPAK